MNHISQDTTASSKNRARGIKASPAKLRAAQLACGFKSQAEIALEIQRLEELDTSPRTMVGRVFRGEAVDPISLERVAKALNVESWNLYLDSQEAENALAAHAPAKSSGERVQTHSESEEPSELVRSSKRDGKFWGLLVVIALLLVAYIYLPRDFLTLPSASLEKHLDFNDKVIVVLPIEGPRGLDISQQIQHLINQESAWISRLPLHAGVLNPLELVRQKKADLVLSGKTEQIGRFIVFQLFATEGAYSRQIWADTLPFGATESFIQGKVANWLSLIKRMQTVINPPWEVLQRYLKGLAYLDGDRATEVLLRAIVELESVVRLAPDFAKGHAALCSALTEYGQLTGDQDKLLEAQIPCQRAISLAAEEIEVKIANANLARKQGDFDHAQQQFEASLVIDANNVDAIRGLAELLMRRYLQQPNNQLFTRTETLLLHAKAVEPNNWKLPYTLARLYYFSGQQSRAINQFTLASEIYPSYQTFFNLGTVEFCKGELAEAKQHYQAALVYQPDESALLSNIATLHQYLGEPEKALTIYQSQLESLKQHGADNLYHVWGNMGEIYRRQGLIDKAIDAYQQALFVLENEIAKGEGNVQQKTLRLVIYLTLAKLQPEAYSVEFIKQFKDQANDYTNVIDPVSVFQMANVWILLGELDKARAMRDDLAASCPGYAASPDFEVL